MAYIHAKRIPYIIKGVISIAWGLLIKESKIFKILIGLKNSLKKYLTVKTTK